MKKLKFTSILILFACFLSLKGFSQTVWSEDFEGTSGTALPSGWNQVSTVAGAWKSGINTGLQSTYFGIPAHTRMVAVNDDAGGQSGAGSDNSNDFVTTPSFSLTGVTGAYLNFDNYYFAGNYNNLGAEVATVEVSTDGGTTWTVLETLVANTVSDFQGHHVSLNSFNNAASVMVGFRYSDGGNWNFGWAIDNVSVAVPAAVSVALTSITPTVGAPSAYGVSGSGIGIGATVNNLGASTITSFVCKYTDGTNTYTDNVSCNIAPFASYSFTHSSNYSLPATLGNHNITVWIEVTNDALTSDDTMGTTLVTASFLPNHQVVVEEGTGTWCGWCPRGAVFMDSMQIVHWDNSVSLIAVHNADPMTVTDYDAGVSGMISGYPSILVDRKEVLDPSQIFDGYTAHQPDFAFADLTMTPTFNGTTVNVAASAHMAVGLSGDYRLALVVTEDDVTGTGSTWDQHNYYSSQSNNLPLVGAGHNWQTEPNPVPAANMKYDHVARIIVGGFTGQTGSLPATMNSGSTYNYTFSNVDISAWTKKNLRLVVMLIDATHNVILNSKSVNYVAAGVTEATPVVSSLNVYPTLVSDMVTVDLTLAQHSDVTMNITDIMGHVISSQSLSNEAAGAHQYYYNTRDLASGVYFVNVVTSSGTISQKIVKAN